MEQQVTNQPNKSQKPKNKLTYTQIKRQQELAKTRRDKEKYFEYYDDIKSNTHKIIDW